MSKNFTVVLKGKNEFKKSLYDDMAKTDIAARNIVTKGAFIIEDSAKEQFRARPGGSRTVAKSGHVYYKGAPQYPASPPMPTNRTSNLRTSIRMRGSATSLGKGRWQSFTGPSVKYAKYVEYGTSRSRNFPYMENGIRNAEDRIEALAREEWATALQ